MTPSRWVLPLVMLAIALGSLYRSPDEALGETGGDGALTSLIDRARADADRGEFLAAERTLRTALRRDPADTAIASMLREVYERGGLKPTPDEQQIEALMAQLPPGFRRTETSRFVVLSNASTSWTRQRERLLERTYHEVMKFAQRVGLPCVPPEHKLVVVLFGEHADYRRFALTHDGVEAGWVAGYYASVPNHAVFYDDRTSPAFAEAHAQLDEVRREAADARRAADARNHPSPEAMVARADALEQHAQTQRERLEEQARCASIAKTTHEAAHLIAFNTNIQLRSRHYPFWITEGLAICFETDDPDKPFGPSRIDETRAARIDELVSEGALVPTDAFVKRTDAHGPDAETIRDEYTQAWAMFRDAARYREEQLVALFASIARSPAGRMSDDEHARLFAASFGDPSVHERAWLRRVR
ncbi:MAG: hypothetical protein Tsb0013_12020 [Phycisphaerales bacterium]